MIFRNIHSHLGVRNLQGVQIIVQPRVMGEFHSSNNFIKILNGLAGTSSTFRVGLSREVFLEAHIELVKEKYSFEYDFLELEGKNAVGLFQMFCR